MWGQHSGKIHLVLTDVVMPRMSGSELAERVKAIRPDTKILFMSGYSEYSGNSLKTPQFPILQKPFSISALVGKVRDAIIRNKCPNRRLKRMFMPVRREFFRGVLDRKESAMVVQSYRAARTGVIACALLLIPGISDAQQAANRDASGADQEQRPPDLANEVRALSDTVRALQAQVQSLNSQLQEDSRERRVSGA